MRLMLVAFLGVVMMGAGVTTRPATTQATETVEQMEVRLKKLQAEAVQLEGKIAAAKGAQASKAATIDALVKKIEGMPKNLWPDGNSDSSSSRRQLQDAWMLEQFKNDETVYSVSGKVIADSVAPAGDGKMSVRLQCGPLKICGVRWNDVRVSATVTTDIATASNWNGKTSLTVTGVVSNDMGGARLLESAGSVEICLVEPKKK